MKTREQQWLPLIVLLLVAALVAMIALYAVQAARKPAVAVGAADTRHAAGAGEAIYRWKLVTTWPKNFPGLGTAPEQFAEAVRRMSAGRLQISVYGAGEIVPALEVFDAVSRGTAEMGHGAAYYWKGKLASAPFFTAVPFGMTAQEMNSWLYYGGGLALWRKAYEPFNLVPFAAGNTGVQMAGWFNREIHDVTDLQGLKMRIPGLAGEVFSRAGGTAVNLPGGEIFTALQTGVIDATEWVGPYNDLAFGLHKAARYYYYPGWHEPGPTLELLVNREAWLSLPEDLQGIVEAAARQANQDMLDLYTARNNAALRELVERHHVELRRLPDSVLLHLHRIANQMLQEMAAADPAVDEVYQSFRQFAEQARAYHHLSEQAYINARDLIDQDPGADARP